MTRLRPSSLGPRRRMNRSCIPLAKRISSYAIGPVWWNNGMSGVRTGSCESGDDKRASMASKAAYKYKYKDYWADRLKGSFWVPKWRYIVFQRKLLSLHYPQGNNKKHTEKDSVFAVGSVSQFWKNCNYTGDNVHERLRSAWAWFRFMCKVFQSRETINVDPSTLSLYTLIQISG